MLSYMDHNASTPMHDEVLQAMLPWLQQMPGNASSPHRFGRAAQSAIEMARSQVAALVNATPEQVVFTSGGTESNNLALQGGVDWNSGDVLLCSPLEHPSVINVAVQLAHRYCLHLQWLPVSNAGVVDLESAQLELDNVRLCSLMLANNETGAIQPVRALSRALQTETRLHVDASQAAGRIPIDFAELGADFLSLSAHKFNGPKGIGVLVVRQPDKLRPLIFGGNQQNGLRSGTENTAAIVGMGQAAEIARHQLSSQPQEWLNLRKQLELGLSEIDSVHIFSQPVERLPNTTYLSVSGLHGETLLMQLDKAGIAVSSGSACHSQVTEPSHVLKAMGVDHDLALGAVRVSIGLGNTAKQIEYLIETIKRLAQQPLLLAGAS